MGTPLEFKVSRGNLKYFDTATGLRAEAPA
jgi:hypothetical protein